jgi:hypothetical protein
VPILIRRSAGEALPVRTIESLTELP